MPRGFREKPILCSSSKQMTTSCSDTTTLWIINDDQKEQRVYDMNTQHTDACANINNPVNKHKARHKHANPHVQNTGTDENTFRKPWEREHTCSADVRGMNIGSERESSYANEAANKFTCHPVNV